MTAVYLCEDEEIQLLRFKAIIEQYIQNGSIDAKVVSARRNPGQTLKDVKEREDVQAVFFIDVELKDSPMNGFELAKELKGKRKNYYFVYLTSHEELAYKVFEYELGVLDYIVKSPEIFLAGGISDNLTARLNTIFGKIEALSNEEKKETLIFECGSRLVEVATSDIIYIQAVKGKHQAEVYTTCQILSIRQPLKSIYEELSDAFIYINKSCIVQKSMIREIDRKSRIVTLKGGYRLEVAIREIKNVCGSLMSNG